MVLSICSLKGGVGKTSVVLGLASAALSREIPTLVIDLDPQADATVGLNVIDEQPTSVVDLLRHPRRRPISQLAVVSGWTDSTTGRLDVVPGSEAGAALDGPPDAMAPSCSGQGTARNFSATPNQSIPDNSPAGVTSTIDVADTGTLTDVKLTVDITHTYRGDLKVTLVHAGAESIVFNATGGSADDLKQTFAVPALNGKALAGEWTLKVVDTAAQDLGVLNSWSLETVAR